MNFYPENAYLLFSPSNPTNLLEKDYCQNVIVPEGIHKIFKSAWRTYGVISDINKNKPDIFHGLSNELPFSIKKFRGKRIVSIHDLIFLKYPKFYRAFDRFVYKNKVRFACNNADMILVTSQQTKEDLQTYYPKIKQNSISVLYQGCNSLYYKTLGKEDKEKIRIKYKLPKQYILCVGTLEERKNFLSVLKAVSQFKIDAPIVLIGKPTPYLEEIKKYAVIHKLDKRLWILHNVETSDLPAVYQSAQMFVYPSVYEGFGIPIIEAFNSGTPVITTNYGSLAEIASDGALLVNPVDLEELGTAILNLMNDSELRRTYIGKAFERTGLFKQEIVIEKLMGFYLSLL